MSPNVDIDIQPPSDFNAIYRTRAGPLCAKSAHSTRRRHPPGHGHGRYGHRRHARHPRSDRHGPAQHERHDQRNAAFVYTEKAATRPSAIPRTFRRVRPQLRLLRRLHPNHSPRLHAPTIVANPLIGPNPLHPDGDTTTPSSPPTQQIRPRKLAPRDRAAASMISPNSAALGVTYSPTSAPSRASSASPTKVNSPSPSVASAAPKSTGFFLDKLALTTNEGIPITYTHAPVLVSDISLKDSAGKEFTLDGVFGMNYLITTAMSRRRRPHPRHRPHHLRSLPIHRHRRTRQTPGTRAPSPKIVFSFPPPLIRPPLSLPKRRRSRSGLRKARTQSPVSSTHAHGHNPHPHISPPPLG